MISLSGLLLYLAFVVFCLFLLEIILRKKCGFDFQEYLVEQYKSHFGKNKGAQVAPITKSTGNKSLVLLDAGANKATVIATLRQIMAIDAITAQSLVNAAPTTILKNVSDTEAVMNKNALEFVGAKLEVK